MSQMVVLDVITIQAALVICGLFFCEFASSHRQNCSKMLIFQSKMDLSIRGPKRWNLSTANNEGNLYLKARYSCEQEGKPVVLKRKLASSNCKCGHFSLFGFLKFSDSFQHITDRDKLINCFFKKIFRQVETSGFQINLFKKQDNVIFKN